LKEYKIALQKTENLEKYNVSLQNQASKYAILLKEEKQEKNNWIAKFEALNQTHFEMIEAF
jgi:hypothetical protein